MSKPVMNLAISEEDEVVAMLARMFYLNHMEHRTKKATPPPFAPEWAFEYARIAVSYCGFADDTIDSLRDDYK